MASQRKQAELEPDRIVMTIELLAQRIETRLPKRNLAKVAHDTRAAAAEAVSLAKSIPEPIIWIRVVSAVLALVMIAVTAKLAYHLKFTQSDGWAMLDGINSGISTLIYLGLAVLFLLTLEMRIKRRRALRALQELRALAHVIDMHQLSKDPQWHEHRESSPWDKESEHMDPYLLGRYLDYCVDLLALIGKLAALYAQNSQDGVVLQAVEEVENLTSTLATKIWQKIMLIDTLQASRRG
ncbi:MAG: hypothetical protein AB8C95_09480 [Phycisphaeraceae bacterium]